MFLDDDVSESRSFFFFFLCLWLGGCYAFCVIYSDDHLAVPPSLLLLSILCFLVLFILLYFGWGGGRSQSVVSAVSRLGRKNEFRFEYAIYRWLLSGLPFLEVLRLNFFDSFCFFSILFLCGWTGDGWRWRGDGMRNAMCVYVFGIRE